MIRKMLGGISIVGFALTAALWAVSHFRGELLIHSTPERLVTVFPVRGYVTVRVLTDRRRSTGYRIDRNRGRDVPRSEDYWATVQRIPDGLSHVGGFRIFTYEIETSRGLALEWTYRAGHGYATDWFRRGWYTAETRRRRVGQVFQGSVAIWPVAVLLAIYPAFLVNRAVQKRRGRECSPSGRR